MVRLLYLVTQRKIGANGHQRTAIYHPQRGPTPTLLCYNEGSTNEIFSIAQELLCFNAIITCFIFRPL